MGWVDTLVHSDLCVCICNCGPSTDCLVVVLHVNQGRGGLVPKLDYMLKPELEHDFIVVIKIKRAQGKK